MDFLPLKNWLGDIEGPLLIAGPCSAESEEQVMETAKQIKEAGQATVFRAGIWKPRTRPNCFEGVGEEGLKWLAKVKKEYGLLTCCEVANARHVELALKHGVDILWIGARTTANPFSVQEIADRLHGIDIPVMVKNPISADLPLWIGAIERIHGAGINKIIAIHRGFSSEGSKYRNRPLWRIPIELKSRFPSLPIICDPSHIAGKRSYLKEVCQKAMDVNTDGLMIETHICPNEALSDAAQQVTPEQLQEIMTTLDLKVEYIENKDFEEQLDQYRTIIDRIDSEIIEALKQRMEAVDQIGRIKQENHVTVLQRERMADLIQKRMKLGTSYGLKENYIKELYDIIHSESVKHQTELIATIGKKNKKSS